jgi:hypothetical protein
MIDTSVLFYFLYPGAAVHLLITGGHGGTLVQERLGFIAGLVTNLAFYLGGSLLVLSGKHRWQ